MGAMKELFMQRDAAGACVLCGQPENEAGPLREFMSSQAHEACIVEADRDASAWLRDMAESQATEAEYRYADLAEAEAIYLNDMREKADAERTEIQAQFDAREPFDARDWYAK